MMQFQNNFETDDSTGLDLSMDWNEILDEGPKFNTEGVHADNAGDGLLLSLKNLGKVDISYISEITGIDKIQIISSLKGAIYQDPEEFSGSFFEGYKTSDEYLSGNLIQKLKAAKKADREYHGRFSDNIEAILSVLPEGVTSDEIYYTLSSPWIPEDIVKSFIIHILGSTYISAFDSIKHDSITGAWEIPSYLTTNVAQVKYGTTKVYASKLIEKVLNLRSTAVYDYIQNGKNKKRVLNKGESILANEKANAIKQAFYDFIDANPELKTRLVDTYNDLYAYSVQRVFNGDFIDFVGMNPAVSLYDYQKNAIARILLTQNTYLAHDVGAGKTYIMIAGGMELLRTGNSHKNLYVVPNSLIGEWKNAFNYLYPNEDVLMLDPKMFTPSKYRSTLELIKSDEYRNIIIAFSSFDDIPLSNQIRIASHKRKLQDIQNIIESGSSYPNALNKLKDKLEEELNKLANNPDLTDEDITFDKLGFDRLFLDEAHNYKNLPLTTKISSIKGINTEGSKKCGHLLDVVDYMTSKKGSGIIMASGTPITNSITDAYVMQRYLQNAELKLLDIHNFDDWVAMFAESTEDLEIDLDANDYRVTTRFSKFHNLPELTQILSSITDFYFDKTDKSLPLFDGYSDTVVDKSSDLKDYINGISERIDNIRNGRISRADDNLLKVTTDGRKAALDLRLIDEKSYQYSPSNKLLAAAENIVDIYSKTSSFKGTQLVFCDVSTPKEGFNIYDELKGQLIKFGIPSSDIAYVHDANTEKQREKLFERVRTGDIRILFGSTFKLGLGVNVQNKLYAIHHLDCPWRPSDMVQREGRIIRQGNTNEQVYIHRYITKGSFDAYSWQLLEIKQKFINQLLSNSVSVRSKEDIDDMALSYSELKALAVGNPLLKEHVTIKNEITRIQLLSKRADNQYSIYERELLTIPSQLEDFERRIDMLSADAKHFEDSKQTIAIEDIRELRTKIYNSLLDNLYMTEEKFLMNYQGFDLYIPENNYEGTLYIRLKGKGNYLVQIGNSEIGAIQRIDNYLDSLDKRLETTLKKKEDLLARREAIRAQLSSKPDYKSQLEELSQKLNEIERKMNPNE